jgi:hypothetical protein
VLLQESFRQQNNQSNLKLVLVHEICAALGKSVNQS